MTTPAGDAVPSDYQERFNKLVDDVMPNGLTIKGLEELVKMVELEKRFKNRHTNPAAWRYE